LIPESKKDEKKERLSPKLLLFFKFFFSKIEKTIM